MNSVLKPKPLLSDITRTRLRESAFVLLLPAALYVLFALWSYTPSDPSWSHAASTNIRVGNLGGRAGAYLADLLLYLFGYLAYLLPISLLFIGTRILRAASTIHDSGAYEPMLRMFGVLLLVLSGSLLLAIRGGGMNLPAGAGGVLGGHRGTAGSPRSWA